MKEYQRDVFYNTRNLSFGQKKELLKFANELSHDTSIQQIQSGTYQRERIDKTFDWFLTIFEDRDHFVVIHRKGYEDPFYGEIGVRTMSMDDYFLYITITEEYLQKVVDKFKLNPQIA